ncbi:centriole, cilia and spindle-associated protein [Dunckerocampus dactyliophorus]|uniref:centriole, cilia and spindle-associated protein n=1 Tax=Dunckerocampus dactyliophorus TaxID=161453 RepID=UPI002404D05F|nr:centriole, cilia and spindle-associated protein [Dunckerocampus dactyliophorus]
MVTKKIRSEYMKKFKDPKWETYTKCYEELLKYRVNRRLLEQSHKPWFWNGSDTDSDSGEGNSTERGEDPVADQLEECQGARTDVPRLPLLEDEQEHGFRDDGVRESRAPEEHRGAWSGNQHKNDTQREPQAEKDPTVPQLQLIKPRRLSKLSRLQRAQQTTRQPPNEDSKHPFALYASGEKDADIAGRKTHNVLPVASTNEIHASALRAKIRREAERQVHTERSERRRNRSADMLKARKTVQPEFNPWLTEYMRCFSARAR